MTKNHFPSFLKDFKDLADSTYLVSLDKESNKKIYNFNELVRVKMKVAGKTHNLRGHKATDKGDNHGED